MKLKALFLDGLCNYLFFTPLVGGTNYIFSGWTMEQLLYYSLFSIPIGFLGGLVFGRFLNRWRGKFKYR